ncbi:MAG: hypothetical protein LUC83_08695 [Clostridiales bacterium]|nr:hypothetical protein [Clostridiales bacterium]
MAVLFLMAACLVGVLLLEPVRGTVAYVTSSPVKVVNTFEGDDEADETPEEPAVPDEPSDTGESDGNDESSKPGESADSGETSSSTESEGTTSGQSTDKTDSTEGTTAADSASEPTAETKTGDNSHAAWYAAAAIIAMAVAFILLFKRGRGGRSKGKREQ